MPAFTAFQPYLTKRIGTCYYLGVPEGQVSCDDLAELPKSATVIGLERPYRNIELLPQFSKIQRLDLSDWDDAWLKLLAKLPNLRQLDLSFLKVETLPSFKPLKSLRVLVLYSVKKLKSLEFLRGMSGLHTLGLSEVMSATDLAPLASLKELRELDIDSALFKTKWVDSLKPLAGLKRLQHLVLSCRVNPANRSLRPLGGLKELRYLLLSEKFPAEEKDWLLARLPKLKKINPGWPGEWPPA
jgi:Leucine-rich repeat (LRR) protein